MTILHLMHDEKFFDNSIKLFETCNPGKNIFLIGVPHEGHKMRFLKTENIHISVFNSTEYYNYIRRLENGDVVIVHFMTKVKCKAVLKIPKHIKVVWSAFGAEFYNSIYFKEQKLHKYTQNYYTQHSKSFKNKLLSAYRQLKSATYDILLLKRAIERVDYFSSPIANEEANLVKASIPKFKAQIVPFKNSSLEQSVGELISQRISLGDGILVGNSNASTSNHVDVFEHLRLIGCTERKIVVPLSYGEGEKYKRYVVTEGERIFGEQFQPILNYMDRPTYTKEVLGACRTVILYHERQQAVGNIILALWLGAKVFLSENSLVYSSFKNEGMNIFSIQSSSKEGLNTGLKDDQVEQNRELCYRMYSHESVLKQIMNMIEVVRKN